MKRQVVAAVVVALCAMGVSAAVFEPEETAPWFSVDISSLADGAALPSGFAAPVGGGEAVVTNAAVSLDTDADDPLVFTTPATRPENSVARVCINFQAAPHYDELEDVADAQAVFAVKSNAVDGITWAGWTGNGWTNLTSSVAPVVDGWYEVMIELDNRSTQVPHRIRYSVRQAGVGDYCVLTNNVGESWLANGLADATTVTNISFSGTGKFSDFSAVEVTEGSSASIAGVAMTYGCDYTNATAAVTVSGFAGSKGMTLTVTVTDKNGNAVGSPVSYASLISANGTYSVAIPSLVAGQPYSYVAKLTVDSGATEVTAQASTFATGETGDWFTINSGNGFVSAGSAWTDGEGASVTIGNYVSEGKVATGGTTLRFTPAAADLSNNYVTVDTAISIASATDSEELEAPGGTAQGGFTLADESGLVWKVWNGTAWVSVYGVAAATGDWSFRTEFDYSGNTKTVRYSIYDGGSYVALTNNVGNAWFNNANQDATALESAELVGTVALSSMSGSTVSPTFFQDGTGTKYTSKEEALASGKSLTALCDMTLTLGTGGAWTINSNGKNIVLSAAPGYVYDAAGNLVRARYGNEAAMGGVEYAFVDNAFGAIAANGATVTLLTNADVSVSFTVPNYSATLDLAGFYLITNANETVTLQNALAVTNSASVGGEISVGFSGGTLTIAGGKWTDSDASAYAGNLASGYKFFGLGEPVALKGVTFAKEAIASAAESGTVIPVTDGGETVASVVVTEAEVAALKTAGLLDDKAYTGAELAEAMNATRETGNKMTLLESYVLGLDPTSSTSVPVVVSPQNATAGKITLSLGNVNVNADAGVKVRYSVSEASSPTGFSSEGEVQDSSTFTLDAPSSGNLKYYRINIHLGN